MRAMHITYWPLKYPSEKVQKTRQEINFAHSKCRFGPWYKQMILLRAGFHIFIQNPARKLIKFCKCIFLPFLDLITPFFDFLIRWKRFKNIENRIEEIRACPWESIFWDCSFNEQISKHDRWSTRFLPKGID